MPILQWLDRDKTIKQAGRVPYRLLEMDTNLSYGDKNSQNMLIQGDNLEALKALLPYYAGKVKCIYIDPPYNTGSAFEHYDDNLEHSKWLDMMYPRLELLRVLLAEDGFFCCHIDDAEGAYLKVLLDEIFGRSNYETTFYIQVRYLYKTLKLDMAYHKQIEQVHIYRKSRIAQPIKPRQEGNFDKFNIKIKTLSEPQKIITLGGKNVEIYLPEQYEIIKNEEGASDGLKEIWATGSILDGNSSGRFFRDYLTGRYEEDGYGLLYKVSGIGDDQFGHRYFTGPKKAGATKGKYYQGVPVDKLEGSIRELPIHNFYDFADRFGNCRHEGETDFRSGKKPEHFLKLILSSFSKEGDLIMDSFSGSGSTIATAHKMNRRWIGIEMGEHAKTHCAARLRKVIDGEQGGISKSVNWQGGGGFRFYHLGETIFDENGGINKNIRFEHLAAHIWFSETKTPLTQTDKSPLLGVYNDTAYYLLYNGILGDKSIAGGNVLTTKILATLPKFNGKKIIYGETSRIGSLKLEENQVIFKQTPYDIKVR
jgi:adenine-specific DNA-methyltransferase